MVANNMKRPEKAVECLNAGFNCAQAVLSTYGPELGLNREAALKVAGALGAGMGRMGETCGAVTGAFMVIGLKYSKTQEGEDELKDKGYQLVRDFAERFKAKHGSIKCQELLQYDLSTPEGFQEAKDRDLFATLCPNFVRNACEIIEELLS